MRALVTGASGFVGRFLCAYLEEEGWQVVQSDTSGEDAIACDISNREDVARLVREAGNLTHVFHLAAITFVPQSIRDPQAVMSVNTLGTMHLAQALLEQQPNAKLIFIGSSEVYGPPQRLPIDETHPINPQNPYAISKAAADQYCAYLSASTELQVVRMRPFNHSGPGQSDQFVLSSFARQIAEIEAGKQAPVLHVGNLQAERDFMHVQDVVRAYVAAALQGHAGEAYNIASGKAHRIAHALNLLRERSTARIEVREDPARMRPLDVPRVEGAYRKFEQDTGWFPEVSFETLLDDLLVSWRAQVALQNA